MLKKGRQVKHGYIVAIDGPAGAGKSTVSRLLAEQLQGMLLDTGAMYRGVAYFALKQGATTEKVLANIARKLKFAPCPDRRHLLINGEELGLKLRTTKVSAAASAFSKFKSVREILTGRQRSLGRAWSRKFPVILEGRDIGTAVFPNANYKFYVTADAWVRAERRFKQLKKAGTKVLLKEIYRQNEARDRQDSTRKHAPLRCADDAVIVDTSHMGIVQVVKFMCDHIRAHETLPNIQKV